MRQILKSSFLWQFTGGFLLGAAGLFALTPAADAAPAAASAISSAQR